MPPAQLGRRGIPVPACPITPYHFVGTSAPSSISLDWTLMTMPYLTQGATPMKFSVKAVLLAGLVYAVLPTAFCASSTEPQTESQGMKSGNPGSTISTPDADSRSSRDKSTGGEKKANKRSQPKKNNQSPNHPSSDSGRTKTTPPEPGQKSN